MAGVVTVPFEDSHYPMLCEWWESHKWPVMPRQFLPQTGIISKKDDVYLCAGFLYKTDSDLCWLEYLISNRQGLREYHSEGVDKCIEALLNEAKRSQFKAVFTSCRNKPLISRYEKHGFGISDSEMTNLIRVL